MKTKNIFKLTLVSLFTAIILIMDFSPLGYIQTGGFVIALMTMPVAIGSVCMGKKVGAYLGGLFGLTSLLMCFGLGFVVDPSASLMFQATPLGTIITCLVPRISAGFLTALIFDIFKRKNRINIVSFSIGCVCMPIFNTIFFLTAYVIFFKNTLLAEVAVKTVFMSAISLNGLIEVLINLILSSAICKVIYPMINNNLSTK